MEKKELVTKLLAARKDSGKTYDELGEGLGLCNVYVAQLFHAQAQLKPESEAKLVQLVPGLSEDLLEEMRKCPIRSYDPTIIQEPNIYRMTEVCLHYGDSIKYVADFSKGACYKVPTFSKHKVLSLLTSVLT